MSENKNTSARVWLIQNGNLAYRENCRKLDQQIQDVDEILTIEKFFKENKIKVVKYNNTIDKSMGVRSYNGFVQLSPDGEQLILTKFKIKENYQ